MKIFHQGIKNISTCLSLGLVGRFPHSSPHMGYKMLVKNVVVPSAKVFDLSSAKGFHVCHSNYITKMIPPCKSELVYLFDTEGEYIGTYPIFEAKKLARERGMQLCVKELKTKTRYRRYAFKDPSARSQKINIPLKKAIKPKKVDVRVISDITDEHLEKKLKIVDDWIETGKPIRICIEKKKRLEPQRVINST